MKRILHIIPSLQGGGAERQLVNLVCNTSPDNFNHFVCTFANSEFFAPPITKAGYKVHELNITAKHPWISGASKFAAIAREFRPDVIHTWLYDGHIVGRLSRLFGVKTPIISSLQSIEYEPEAISGGGWSPTKVNGLRQVDKLTTALAKPYFVACSNIVKKSFEKRLSIDGSKIKVIYNGINPETLTCAADEPAKLRQNFEIPSEAFVFISIGRLDKGKNHSLLLKAFPQVLSAVPNAFLVIVGAGVLEQELKKMMNDLGIDSHVRFFGRRHDIGACLEMSDAYVFPTLFEGLPLSLTEAMFKNLPCAASRIEVLREVLTENETGLLFDPFNPNELGEKMILLAKNSELRRSLSQRALRDANKRFNICQTIKDWQNFYYQAL